ESPLTLPISATGSGGMEALISNLVDTNDKVVVGINGAFGERASEMFKRRGAKVFEYHVAWGKPLDMEELAALSKDQFAKIIWAVHGETSTGVKNDIEALGQMKHESLLIADCVTSLGGVEVDMEGWGIDALLSGSQKCLSTPPGLSPVSVSTRCMEHLVEKPTSWYFDLNLVADYVLKGGPRRYHHTAPTSMIVALNESLRLILVEGLEQVIERHRRASLLLAYELGSRDISLLVDEKYRLEPLTTVQIPPKFIDNEAQIRRVLLEEFKIEIGGGLGPLQGKVWRIGLMGYNANEESVARLMEALDKVLV
ncbi:MAG: aminotransferase class V-fold PLP-dependent enzyme, partial [Acidimicrobiales bacterium]|nr:aminotransferase class V-fold PLP-dependent enzyme [Acidimicrobiales bacterium]